jgi:hypothetical protein
LQTDYAFWTIEEEAGRLKKRGAWVIHELDGKTYVLELIWTVNTSLQRDNVDLNS